MISEDKNGDNSTIAAADWSVSAQDLLRPDPLFLSSSSTIQQTMEAFYQQRMSSLLVAEKNTLDASFTLLGRICLKDVFRQIFFCLMQKDLINLNQVLHHSIEKILISSQKTIKLQSKITEILSVMLTDFPYVTGVVSDGKLIGQVSCTDLLGLFKMVNGKDSPAVQLMQHALPGSARVSEAMARHVLCLSPRDEVSKAMGILMATDTPGIPVLDERGGLRRIISRMDVLGYVLKLLGSSELVIFDKKGLILDRTIDSLDEKEFATVSTDDSLAEAVKTMIEKKCFCLVVRDVRRSFCGLLAFKDILSWLYTYLQQHA